MQKEREIHHGKACDKLKLYGIEGSKIRTFVIKKSGVYPYWVIQPDFKDELQTDTAKELYELEDPNEVL